MTNHNQLPRLIFAGTPDFAESALLELISNDYPVSLVLTQPDRPSGRGYVKRQSRVKMLANKFEIPVYQPQNLTSEKVEQKLRSVEAEYLIVAAYGLIIPKSILEIFKNKCINIHASLLPRWRGAAPIQRAILAGDQETGICIMQMDEGLDTGPIYLTEKEKILPSDTAGSLENRLKQKGAKAIVKALNLITSKSIKPLVQRGFGVTYAAKLNKTETKIDWTEPAFAVERSIRAFSPQPGAYTSLNKTNLKIWHAGEVDITPATIPGTVLVKEDKTLVVTCGQNALKIEELQLSGKRRMKARDFILGFRSINGQIMGD